MGIWYPGAGTRRERDELRAQLDGLRSRVPLAEEIAAWASGEVNPVSEAEQTAYVEGLKERERRQTIADAVRSMGPEEQYGLLASLYGDEALQHILAEQREAARQKAGYDDKIALLKAEGTQYGSISLTGVPLRAIVELNMYDRKDLASAEGDFAELRNGYLPSRVLRVAAAGDSGFSVVSDFSPDDSFNFRPALNAYELVRLGSVIPPAAEDASLDPTLYIGGGVNCQVGGEVSLLEVRSPDRHVTPLVLGSCLVGNETVLS